MKPKKIILFASGSGSNVENIADFFYKSADVSIAAVFANKRDAAVIDRCNRLKIPVLYFNKVAFMKEGALLHMIKSLEPDLIVLAGFLWKIPKHFTDAFPNSIVNIHPALLPKYGGKGMYGAHVHQAVKDSGDTETGITIHYVNENYDEGAIIHQEKTSVSNKDSAADIAQKVHALEYEFFPKVISKILEVDTGTI